MGKTSGAVMRRLLLVAGLVMAGLSGCSSTGFDTNALAPPGFARGTRGTMDGFVFVPSRGRQAATGVSIPNAIINVYRIVGGGQPNVLLASTQADAEGFYRVEGMPLNTLLLVEAIDPFVIPGQPQRKVTGVISFQVAEERTRNLNEASTVAAAIVAAGDMDDPLSDQQISELEALAEERLNLPGAPDVTADPDALADLVDELDDNSFGALDVYVYSDPVATATVLVNGLAAGSVTTALPSVGRTEATNVLHLTQLVRGQVNLRIEAPGFAAAVLSADVVAGETSMVSRVLVPLPAAGQNKPPTIVDQRAMPARLGFAGGEVALQAIVVDADGDAVDVVAEVTPSSLAARTTTNQTGWTVPLTLTTDHQFSGILTVPGNPNTTNETYVVVIRAHDEAHAETPTEALLTFQVAGTIPPPPPPSEQ